MFLEFHSAGRVGRPWRFHSRHRFFPTSFSRRAHQAELLMNAKSAPRVHCFSVDSAMHPANFQPAISNLPDEIVGLAPKTRPCIAPQCECLEEKSPRLFSLEF